MQTNLHAHPDPQPLMSTSFDIENDASDIICLSVSFWLSPPTARHGYHSKKNHEDKVLIDHNKVLLTRYIKLGSGVVLSCDLGLQVPGRRVLGSEGWTNYVMGQIFSIASWQANGCTHDASKKTLEMILQQKICPLLDLFVLNSLSEFVNNIEQNMILLERK